MSFIAHTRRDVTAPPLPGTTQANRGNVVIERASIREHLAGSFVILDPPTGTSLKPTIVENPVASGKWFVVLQKGAAYIPTTTAGTGVIQESDGQIHTQTQGAFAIQIWGTAGVDDAYLPFPGVGNRSFAWILFGTSNVLSIGPSGTLTDFPVRVVSNLYGTHTENFCLVAAVQALESAPGVMTIESVADLRWFKHTSFGTRAVYRDGVTFTAGTNIPVPYPRPENRYMKFGKRIAGSHIVRADFPGRYLAAGRIRLLADAGTNNATLDIFRDGSSIASVTMTGITNAVSVPAFVSVDAIPLMQHGEGVVTAYELRVTKTSGTATLFTIKNDFSLSTPRDEAELLVQRLRPY